MERPLREMDWRGTLRRKGWAATRRRGQGLWSGCRGGARPRDDRWMDTKTGMGEGDRWTGTTERQEKRGIWP